MTRRVSPAGSPFAFDEDAAVLKVATAKAVRGSKVAIASRTG